MIIFLFVVLIFFVCLFFPLNHLPIPFKEGVGESAISHTHNLTRRSRNKYGMDAAVATVANGDDDDGHLNYEKHQMKNKNRHSEEVEFNKIDSF